MHRLLPRIRAGAGGHDAHNTLDPVRGERQHDFGAVVATRPWPKAVRAPSRAALEIIGPPVAPPAIVTRAAKQATERKRILQQKRAGLLGETHALPVHQVTSGKVKTASWVDPDDLSPNRRVARQISGHRSATDAIQLLLDGDSVSKKQAGAAVRLRKSYEVGVVGSTHGPRWDSVPAGYGPGDGPTVAKLAALERFQRAQAALGRLFDVVLSICLEGETISGYATRIKANRQTICGRLGAALDRLLDHWEELDAARKREADAYQQPVAAQ
jgi:hypothetical protein